MSGTNVGHVLWTDLTVPNADEVRQFYEAVIGWTSSEVSLGDYSDYVMMAPGDRPKPPTEQNPGVVGICHSRGVNADLPAQWLNYFGVADLDTSRGKVEELGGKLIGEIRSYGDSRFCVVEDPAGAVCGLFENVVSEDA